MMSDKKYDCESDIYKEFYKALEPIVDALVKPKDKDEDLLIKLPEHANCNHGITFDLEEAKKILAETKEPEYEDPALAFIMGPVNSSDKIRKRFPRLCGVCPKGCGYQGIYYASMEHYIYGDW